MTVFAEDQLTDVQKKDAERAKCPHCGNGMKILEHPQKPEHYCAPCHFSFPMFKR